MAQFYCTDKSLGYSVREDYSSQTQPSGNEHAEPARRAIAHFPESEIKRALLWIPAFVVGREK